MKRLFLLIIFLLIISVTGCDKTKTIRNPYGVDTGHYAGYEWAKKNYSTWLAEFSRTGKTAECDGNSESFAEGCLEYIKQVARDSEEQGTVTSGYR